MNKLIALGYHSIGVLSPKLSVKEDIFESHIKYLKNNGYSFLQFKDIYNFIKEGKKLPIHPVLIYFDDGYRDNYLNAYPILKKYGVLATIFLVTNFIDGKSAPSWTSVEESLSSRMFLSWSEIGAMRDVFEIGSHSTSHKKLGKLSDEEASHELEFSRGRLEEEFGEAPTAISFPHSSINSKTNQLARKAGYKVSISRGRGFNYTTNNMFLKKIPITPNDDLKTFSRKLNWYPVLHFKNQLKNIITANSI